MARYRIRNWDTYQHYKDRDPPWIKLHTKILSSADWVMLDDAGKLLAIACMVIASKSGGEIDDNPDYIQRVAYLRKRPDLKPLISCGFLEPVLADASALQSDASAASKMLADARPEEETETETEKKELMSADADPRPLQKAQKKTKFAYPEDFEAFWKAYPTDPLMSKKAAFERWKKLSPDDQASAVAAIPGFREYCSKNKTYRPVHAERFISERRFDGFSASVVPLKSPEELADLEDKIDRLMRRGKYAEKYA